MNDLTKEPHISVLIASRKNSKFLAKLLFSLLNYSTSDSIEVLCMYSAEDTWNKELIQFFSVYEDFSFYPESYGFGRAGLHLYFNELATHARGHWLIYFCDDHAVIYDGWDSYLLQSIEEKNVDYKKIYTISPRFDNTGAVNHVISRGYYDHMGSLGQYGNIDSYLNFVGEALPEDRHFYTDRALFHDFTVDTDVLSIEQTIVTAKSDKIFPGWDSVEIQNMIKQDQEKIREGIVYGL